MHTTHSICKSIEIISTGNLNGFTETIRSVFLQSSTQICVVHQIKNSCKYVVYKDKKEFTTDIKNIYNAPNKEAASMELDNLEKKWGGKYPYAILSWRRNWDDLTVFFQFPLKIRNIIYTTNLIENLNGKIRKYTKSLRIQPLKSLFILPIAIYVRNGLCHWLIDHYVTTIGHKIWR